MVSANLAWQYVGSQVIKGAARNAQAFTSGHHQTLDVNTKWTVTPALTSSSASPTPPTILADRVATDADFIPPVALRRGRLQAVIHPVCGSPGRGFLAFLPPQSRSH